MLVPHAAPRSGTLLAVDQCSVRMGFMHRLRHSLMRSLGARGRHRRQRPPLDRDTGPLAIIFAATAATLLTLYALVFVLVSCDGSLWI